MRSIQYFAQEYPAHEYAKSYGSYKKKNYTVEGYSKIKKDNC